MIRMSNNREVQVAYKVKTTAPEHYRVKPTVGLVEPGQEVEVSVQLTPGKKWVVNLLSSNLNLSLEYMVYSAVLYLGLF